MAYTITFLLISMVYRYTLTQEHQMQLEKLIRWCRLQSSGIVILLLIFTCFPHIRGVMIC